MRVIAIASAIVASMLSGCVVGAQTSGPRALPRALERPTSWQTDRVRLRQLRGDTTDLDSYLLRSSSLSQPRMNGVTWLFPDVLSAANLLFPYSTNDGALWAGKGVSARVGGGVEVAYGRWRLVLAPDVTFSSNAPFETNENNHYYSPVTPVGYAVGYADPWYIRPFSADVPRRFGRMSFTKLNPGQSGLWVTAGKIEFGITSENMWWGPGIQNGIIMSDNAAGIPRLELRLPEPWRTSVGAFDARWFVGALQESQYFDNDPSNDVRSLAAGIVTWRPWFQPHLTLGVERAVFATVNGYDRVPLHWLDLFANTGHPANHVASDSSLTPGGRDQLFGLFGRWIFPDDGFEMYAEWTHQELPRSLHEFLDAPTNSHGYTVGLQWLRPGPTDRPTLRIQAEVTTLEQSSSFRDHNIGVFYTSRRVLQGYTQQGQPIGAAIGPGSSSQWLAFDRIAPTWSWGITLNRVRWNEDVHSIYTWPGFAGYCNHDISIIAGARASRLTSRGTFGGELLMNSRHNVFFQNVGGCKSGAQNVVEAKSPSLRLTYSPKLHW